MALFIKVKINALPRETSIIEKLSGVSSAGQG
jgi:hypothetical protein